MQKTVTMKSRRLAGSGHPLARMLKCWQLYVLLAPALLYILIFHYQPMYGLQIAFRDYMANFGLSRSPWVGMKHFIRFVNSSQFSIVINNTLSLNLFSLLVGFPLPIFLAILLNECQNTRFKRLVQNATYMPHFVSTVVVVSMVISFLSPSIGVINKLIIFLGGEAKDYMAKPEWFRPIYILSGLWEHTGWGAIIYLAALSAVDPTFHEAAQIDGASRMQRIWHINIPGILPTMVTLFILRCGQVMNVGFEKVYLMQNALNMSTSEVISTYVYRSGLLGAQFSFSAAVGLFNSIINFSLILSVNAIARRINETTLW